MTSAWDRTPNQGTAPAPGAWPAPDEWPASGAPAPTPARSSVDDLPFAAAIVAALAVVGALAGLVWALWSPPGPRAAVVRPGVFIPDETESFVAGDGRYLLIVVLVGLGAGFLVWTRVHRRGPLVLAALAVGGLVGALLTELVGHLTGGGTFDGKTGTLIEALPLSLHIPGLALVESVAAVMVYGLFAAFAVHDDLGRPDPVRDRLRPPAVPVPAWPVAVPASAWAAPSVGPGDHPQDGRGHGDGPGPLQQGDLTPQ